MMITVNPPAFPGGSGQDNHASNILMTIRRLVHSRSRHMTSDAEKWAALLSILEVKGYNVRSAPLPVPLTNEREIMNREFNIGDFVRLNVANQEWEVIGLSRGEQQQPLLHVRLAPSGDKVYFPASSVTLVRAGTGEHATPREIKT